MNTQALSSGKRGWSGSHSWHEVGYFVRHDPLRFWGAHIVNRRLKSIKSRLNKGYLLRNLIWLSPCTPCNIISERWRFPNPGGIRVEPVYLTRVTLDHPSSNIGEVSEVLIALLSYTNSDTYWIISQIRRDNVSVSVRNAQYIRSTCETAAWFCMSGCRPEKAFVCLSGSSACCNEDCILRAVTSQQQSGILLTIPRTGFYSIILSYLVNPNVTLLNNHCRLKTFAKNKMHNKLIASSWLVTRVQCIAGSKVKL
jgi:hypothetical protein